MYFLFFSLGSILGPVMLKNIKDLNSDPESENFLVVSLAISACINQNYAMHWGVFSHKGESLRGSTVDPDLY